MLKEHWECGSCKLGLPSLFSAHFCFFPSHRSLYLVNSTDETECEKCEVARPEENQEALDIIEEEEEEDEDTKHERFKQVVLDSGARFVQFPGTRKSTHEDFIKKEYLFVLFLCLSFVSLPNAKPDPMQSAI